MLSGVWTDLRYAGRVMRRNPGYAATAVVCLALAMGVNTTLFGFLDSMFFRRLPVPDASRLMTLKRPTAVFTTFGDMLHVRDSLRSMDAAGALVASTYVDIDRINVMTPFEVVTGNYARVLRLGTSAGRWFGPDADSPAHEPVAVISEHLWSTRLNRDPGIVGKQVVIQEMPYRVIGVGPRGFRGVVPPIGVDMWVPAASLPHAQGIRMNGIARLSDGATIQSATAELRVLDAASGHRADELLVEPASGLLISSWRKTLTPVLSIMAAACGMILLIACVNVANLLLSRAASREREIAVRQALGASRGRLFRASFVEALLLGAGGAVLGVIAGYWTGRAIELALPSIPIANGLNIALDLDWRVLALLAAATVVSAVLFCAPPALHGIGTARKRQRESYTLAQVALSLTLLIAAGLLLRALQKAEGLDRGFATANRLSVNLAASPRMAQPQQVFSSLLARVREIPGVEAATLASGPLGPAPGGCASTSAAAPVKRIARNLIEPNYFDVMAVSAVAGSADVRSGVVVNQTMAREWWRGENPVGKTLWLGCDVAKRSAAVVTGVARDTEGPSGGTIAAYYESRFDEAGVVYGLVLKTAGKPYQWTQPLLKVLEASDPNLRVYEIQSLEDAASLTYWQVKWQAALAGALGLLAIVLAALGLYGVMAFAVSRRTREIGVRMALGALPGTVQRMVLWQGLRVTAIGIGIGLVLSTFAARLLRGYLNGVSMFDPAAFIGASLAWIAVAALASWQPARRASRIDPMTALKYE